MWEAIKRLYTNKPLAAKLHEDDVKGVNQLWNSLTQTERNTISTRAAAITPERPEELIGFAISEVLRNKMEKLHVADEFRRSEAINYFKQRCFTGDKQLYEQIVGKINSTGKLIQKRNKACNAVSSNITPEEVNKRLAVIINRLGKHYNELIDDCVAQEQNDQDDATKMHAAKTRVDEAIRTYVERATREVFDKLTVGENALKAGDIFEHVGGLLFGEDISLGEHISKISSSSPHSPAPSHEMRNH